MFLIKFYCFSLTFYSFLIIIITFTKDTLGGMFYVVFKQAEIYFERYRSQTC